MERGASAVLITCIFTFIAFFFVVIRCISRFVLIRQPGADDFIIIGALILSIATTIIVGLQKGQGLGKHNDQVTPANITHILQLLYASILTYNLGLYLIKISICVQYMRIFTIRKYKYATWTLITVICCGGIAFLFLLAFVCVPVSKYWDNSVEGRCLSSEPVWFSASTFAIITDFSVWVLPIPVVWGLQLPRKQKWGLLFVFMLGFFGCIVGVLRLQSIYAASQTTDLTFHNVASSTWSSIEINIGIMCACIPTIRPLLGMIFPRLIQSTRQNTTAVTTARRYHQFNDSTIELSNAEALKHDTYVNTTTREDDGSVEGGSEQNGIQVKQEWLVTSHRKE